MRGGIRTFLRALAESFSHGIVVDIGNVNGIIIRIPDTMILKSLLPDFHIRAKFLLRSEGESAFDELNCFLQAGLWGDEHVKVVRHDHKFMKKIGRFPIVIERVDEKPGPALVAEQFATLPC